MNSAIILLAIFGAALSQPIGDEICGRSGDGTRIHPECNKFYVCSNGVTSVITCPNNLYYNDKIGACDHREAVAECKNNGGVRPVVPVSEEEDSEQEVPADQVDPAPVVPEPEVPKPVDPVVPEPEVEVPKPEDPTPIKPEPETPVVSPVDGKCPSAPYYYLTNPSDPNSFLLCSNGQPNGSGNCGEGLVFSQSSQACVYP